MAKKISESVRKDLQDREVYPWLRLLELEIQQPDRERAQPHRGRGRPPNPFPRHPIHVTLTEDELAALDRLAEFLSERVGRLHRGHLIAFITFYIQSKLLTGAGDLSLPADVRSLSDLAHYLDTRTIK